MLRRIYHYVDNLTPRLGSLYHKAYNAQVINALVLGELTNMNVLVKRIYNQIHPDDLETYCLCDLITEKMMGVWLLNCIAKESEELFNQYVRKHDHGGDFDILCQMTALDVNDGRVLIQTDLTEIFNHAAGQDYVRRVNSVKHYLTEDNTDWLYINAIHSELVSHNSMTMVAINEFLTDTDHLIENEILLHNLKRFSKQILDLTTVKGNILPKIYEIFGRITDDYIRRHDKTYVRNHLKKPKLTLL